MSPNTHSSEYKPSTSISSNSLNNNSSNTNNSNDKNPMDNLSRGIIIITKHLCEPCPINYVDYFESISIICKDPSHMHVKDTSEDEIDKKPTDNMKEQFKDVTPSSSNSFKR